MDIILAKIKTIKQNMTENKINKVKEYIKNRKEEIWKFYGTLNEIKGRDLIEFQTLSQIENIIKE